MRLLNRVKSTSNKLETNPLEKVDLNKINMAGVNETILRSSICRQSFWEFVKMFWPVVVAEKLVPNWHMKYLCDEMQKCAERVFKGERRKHDEIFNVPPGSSKSTICSVMFPVWLWTRMPSARSICCSFSHDQAIRLARLSRRVVKSDLYQKLFPEIILHKDQDAISEFGIQGGGVRFAIGSGTQIMGSHSHFIIIDDPINPKGVLSELELNKVNNWIKEELSGRKVDKLLTVTIMVMQRLHQNDPAAQMGAKKKIKWVKIPATDKFEISPPGLRKYYKPDPKGHKGVSYMDPIRLSQDALDEVLEGPRGEYTFAGQYGQDPVPPGGGMFKTKRITIVPKYTAMPNFKQVVRFWDKAGTLGGGAYTVGIKMGITKDNRVFILDVIRTQVDSYEREKIIRQTARMDGMGVVVGLEQEGGSGGKESAENTVRRLIGFKVKVINPKGKKEERADPFSTQVNSGNVYMVEADWNDVYIDEMKFFPVSTYKDQIDASSGCFTILLKGLRRIGGMRRGESSLIRHRKRMMKRINRTNLVYEDQKQAFKTRIPTYKEMAV